MNEDERLDLIERSTQQMADGIVAIWKLEGKKLSVVNDILDKERNSLVADQWIAVIKKINDASLAAHIQKYLRIRVPIDQSSCQPTTHSTAYKKDKQTSWDWSDWIWMSFLVIGLGTYFLSNLL